MRSRTWSLLAVLALLAGVLVAGCGDDDDDGDGAAGGDFGTLTVGSDIPFPPFEQGQPPNYEGYDIDIVNEVAERIGAEVEIQDTAFDTIFRDLAQGKFDLVASASTITEERENAVDFSDPYYEAQQALVVTPDSDIASEEDLAGVTVGTQDGTTGEEYANDETEAGSVRGFPTGPDAINAVRAGQVDAVILDEPVAQDAVEKQGGVEIAATISTDELYGLAFQPDADDLREAVNDALAEMKEDGTLAELYEKWFPGTEPPETVLNGTNELLTDE